MNIFSKITARTMGQNKTRTIVTIIGVMLSAAMITAVTTFGASLQGFLVEYSISRDGKWHVMAASLTPGQAKEIANKEEVKSAAAVTELGYALFEPVRENSPSIPYLYVQALSEEALAMLPVSLTEGRMPREEDEVAIPSYLLANEQESMVTKVGDTLTLRLGERTLDGEHLNQRHAYMEGEESFTPKTEKTFRVVGIYEKWPNLVFEGAGYDVLAGPGTGEGSYQDLFLELKSPREVYSFAEEYLSDTETVYNSSLLRWLGVSDNDNFFKVIAGLMCILILVIMAGSITLIYNAFSISLRERTTQFGLLSSIGATKKQLRTSMRYEALFVSAVGIPLGILAGIGGIGVTLHYIGGDITNFIHGTQTGIDLVVEPWSVCSAMVIALLTILISVWIPSRRIRRISPIEAIRANTDVKIRPREVKTAKWVPALFGIEGMMAEKNYKRDRKKYRATVVSLTMSIVLFTTAALFNIYLTKTGAFVLEAPEVELEYRIYEDTDFKEQKEAEEIVTQAEGVTSVFVYRKAYLTLQVPNEWLNPKILEERGLSDLLEDGKTPLELAVLVLQDPVFERYAKSQGADPDAYQKEDQFRLLYVNKMKIYNSQTQRYERATVFEQGKGEVLKAGLLTYEEEGVAFEAGFEAELGDAAESLPKELESLEGQITALIPEEMYLRFRGLLEGKENQASCMKTYSIRCEEPAGTFERIEKALKQKNLDQMGYLDNLAAQYESDRNALAAVKVLTYGFIILISLIAVANVFNTISTNLLLRRREFAMLRSMGMSPKGFRRMMNYECLIYGMRAIAYGVILTILISLAIRRTIGAGADIDFLIPWGYLGAAVLGIFLVVFITMMYTMYKIKRNNIVEELKMS